jgi:hypothetical protein
VQYDFASENLTSLVPTLFWESWCGNRLLEQRVSPGHLQAQNQ